MIGPSGGSAHTSKSSSGSLLQDAAAELLYPKIGEAESRAHVSAVADRDV
jgi:hypothetical protein